MALAALIAATSAQAESTTFEFDIGARPLVDALRTIARRTGENLLVATPLVAGRQAAPLRGSYTADEALKRLLAGSGLRMRRADERSIVIEPTDSGREPMRPRPILLAQAVARPGARSEAASRSGDSEPPAAGQQLEAVVVTATRQSESINHVPLSVSAQTQRALDQQGVRSISDLQAIVPALQVTQNSSGLATPSIRGISSTAAAVQATVGVYIDDTPVQKRNGIGIAGASGAPIPPLFDLERIEVLRGPQGTLFGGGSEGGTIRFITPQPSLTRYSVYARAEAAAVEYGQPRYEAGLAVGGPIVEDKLGFRASFWARHTGGWVDLTDYFTPNQVNDKDSNSGDARLGRLSLAWAPTSRAKITLSAMSSNERQASTVTAYTKPINQPINVQTVCFNTTAITPQHPVAAPAPVAIGDAACAAATAAGRANFTRPGGVYGPYPNLGPGVSAWPYPSPAVTTIQLGSLSFDYDFGDVSFKSITSYLRDRSRTGGYTPTELANRNAFATIGPYTINRGLPFIAGCDIRCMHGLIFDQDNERHGLVQEMRFSSAPNAAPLSWVAGVYYSNMRVYNVPISKSEVESPIMYGLSVAQRYGVPNGETAPGVFNGHEIRYTHMKDVESALFGEANYQVTRKLRLTAGLRVSRVEFSFNQADYGPIAGFSVPTVVNGGLSSGQTTEDPITPRFTAEYQFTADDMVYATASKGFRAGGANPLLPAAYCNPPLAAYGLTINDVPGQYASDTVWNYELGSKTRLLDNRLQVNASLFRMDWRNAQISTTLGSTCGINFTLNAGAARSQGVELEAQARLFAGLSANFSFAYTDAKYTEDAVAIPANPKVPGSQPLIAGVRGQRFEVPPVTLNLGARYDFDLGPQRFYLRGDWQYRSKLTDTSVQIWGTSRYSPDARYPAVQEVNLRAGVEYRDFDINIFVNNLFNEMNGPTDATGTSTSGGRQQCQSAAAGGTPACTTYSFYNPFSRVVPVYLPRTVGIQITYRR